MPMHDALGEVVQRIPVLVVALEELSCQLTLFSVSVTHLAVNQALDTLLDLLDVWREALRYITDDSIYQELQRELLAALHDADDGGLKYGDAVEGDLLVRLARLLGLRLA